MWLTHHSTGSAREAAQAGEFKHCATIHDSQRNGQHYRDFIPIRDRKCNDIAPSFTGELTWREKRVERISWHRREN